MSNKDVIGQEILLFDAIASIAKLLDQLSHGLCSLKVLRTMRAFPDLFLHLFTYTACIQSSDVQEAVYVDEEKQMFSLVMKLWWPICITLLAMPQKNVSDYYVEYFMTTPSMWQMYSTNHI